MKAIVYDNCTSPDVLETQDIDKPEGKATQDKVLFVVRLDDDSLLVDTIAVYFADVTPLSAQLARQVRMMANDEERLCRSDLRHECGHTEVAICHPQVTGLHGMME